MPIETINRTVLQYYEEVHLQEINRQLYTTLFSLEDTNTSAGFLLDRYSVTPAAVAYVSSSSPAVTLNYQEGSSIQISPPRLAQRTPINRELKDKAIAGVEAAAGYGPAEIQMIGQITKTHVAAINMTKNKQALEVFLEGEFRARGSNDADLDMDIDYSRDDSLSFTYDTQPTAASVGGALSAALGKLSKFGAPLDEVIVLLGGKWITYIARDADIQRSQAFNLQNVLTATSLLPENVRNTEGLKLLAMYRGLDMITGVSLCAYTPRVPYVAPGVDASTPYIPDDKAIVLSLQSDRYRINRGMDVFDPSGNSQVVAQEIAPDTYTTPDPIIDYIRSQSRHAFVPANINHTAVITGLFATGETSAETPKETPTETPTETPSGTPSATPGG